MKGSEVYAGTSFGDYRKATLKETLPELKEAIKEWAELAPDAWAIVSSMDEEMFVEYRKGRLLEQQRIYAGDEWTLRFRPVALPELLVVVRSVAEDFFIIEGLAFIRMREAGKIKRQECGCHGFEDCPNCHGVQVSYVLS